MRRRLLIWFLLLLLPAVGQPVDLTLEKTVERALDRNQGLEASREAVTQALARFEQTNALKMPTLTLSGQLIGQRRQAIDTSGLLQALPTRIVPPDFPDEFVLAQGFQQQANASLELLLTTFGKVENNIVAAFLRAKAENESFEVDRQQLIHQSKSAFLNLLTAYSGVETARLILESNEAHLKQTEVFLEQGIVSRFDVVKAELEVGKAEEALASALSQQDLAQAQLLFIFNDPPPFQWRPVAPPPPEVDIEIPLSSLQEIGLKLRPEMRMVDLTLEASQKLVDAAYAESNPSLTLTFSYVRQGGSNLSPVELPRAILGFQIPLWDGGVRAAKVKEAESAFRSLEANAAVLKAQVLLEVEKAWIEFRQALVERKTAEKNLETATLSHRMAQARYSNGISSSLEVEDALRSLNDARLQTDRARYRRDLAFASLEKALGTEIRGRELDLEFVEGQLKNEE